MSSRRIAKVAEAVREQVSTAILFDLKDPRVKNVTVTRVEVSPDLRNAKVYVSLMGDEKTQRLTLRGLQSARGFLQAKFAERVEIRYTPILHFELDQGVKRSIEASRLLREVLPQPSETESDALDEEMDVEVETEDGLLDDHASDAQSDDDQRAEAEPSEQSDPSAPTLRTNSDQDQQAKRQP
jgi:ribosome-binding factor A